MVERSSFNFVISSKTSVVVVVQSDSDSDEKGRKKHFRYNVYGV